MLASAAKSCFFGFFCSVFGNPHGLPNPTEQICSFNNIKDGEQLQGWKLGMYDGAKSTKAAISRCREVRPIKTTTCDLGSSSTDEGLLGLLPFWAGSQWMSSYSQMDSPSFFSTQLRIARQFGIIHLFLVIELPVAADRCSFSGLVEAKYHDPLVNNCGNGSYN